jgi:LysR family transcriptional regulator, transcriptional activator for bauABCD operon
VNGKARPRMSVDNADIRLLRMFIKIVEAGGFTAAQGELNLTLSTISGKISALEERLGVVLCKRGRAGFSLTEEGRSVYEEASRLFASLSQFNSKVTSLRTQLGGTLSIGMVDNTISDPSFCFSRVIGRLNEAAPSVGLNIVTKPPGELLRDVISGQVHVAIGSFPDATVGLSYLDLYEEAHHFYCGEAHPLFDVPDDAIDLSSIRRHKIIARSYMGARDIKVFAVSTPDAMVSDMEAEAHLILSGAYLGYLPEHYAERFVQERRLRPMRPTLFSYSAQFQAAFDESKGKSPAVRLLLEELPRGRNLERAGQVPRCSAELISGAARATCSRR